MKIHTIVGSLSVIFFILSFTQVHAITMLADQSYYPALLKAIEQSTTKVGVTVSALSVDKNNKSDPVLKVLTALARAAQRGVQVAIEAPLPQDISKKLSSSGIKIVSCLGQFQQTKICVDGEIIIGSHSWTKQDFLDGHALSFLFKKQDLLSSVDERYFVKYLTAGAAKSTSSIVIALNNGDFLNKKDKEKFYNLLKNKQINNVPVKILFDQNSVSSYSILNLFTKNEKNLEEAQALSSRKIPVWLDMAGTGFNFQLFVFDDVILFKGEPKEAKKSKKVGYHIFQSLEMSLQVKEYLESIPRLLVKDIIKYN
ncbi:MAG: hypothetical protein DKM50_07270 [Candidatus Margulisiibacteriota bacterium]|nr:MAG: hypothetical protein A2X43_12790 [Candidatus Margulisbacteria bacterium GWD2_39_127]OGI02107.1 MAG: hypothetical protein A2X42_01405 [Candidatus Margulisbacteria bacterium GWF2_38_17]OGI10484.1 MAG: hypothetical protein A2X41_06905 [Candidatus Margulisbacteria bacterium GWE2_39_32]PZM79970.1 MAG: hypothetical protein DKM50_07270 [Candidatus Margulisiibacteriota bacterium]HAR62436.1 hypothetical protein [Candidatus Margulisiibacteriota bacterium]